MKTNIESLKKIIRKIIVEMQDMPPSRREEKLIIEPGIYNNIPITDFYCIWKGGENPNIIKKLNTHQTDSDLNNFAFNFKKNVGKSEINSVLDRYKVYLNNPIGIDLFKRIIYAFEFNGFIFDKKDIHGKVIGIIK